MKTLKQLNPNDQNIVIRAKAAATLTLGTPVKLAVNATYYGYAQVEQIPYVIKCTSATDDGCIGIAYPDNSTKYTKNSSSGHYEAVVGDVINVVIKGPCYADIDSGSTINTTTASYGPYVSCGTTGIVECPIPAAGAVSYYVGKLLIEATGYDGSLFHEVLIDVGTGAIGGATLDYNAQTLAGDGAVTFTKRINECHMTKAGVAAATLAVPVAGDIGKILVLMSDTANAHVCTSAAVNVMGYSIMTFGAAAKNYIALQCIGTAGWVQLGGLNVTLS